MKDVISQNHNSIYASHPGRKWILDVTCIRYWWPKMRQDVERHVRQCDECQRRKQGHEYIAPLREVRDPTYPLEITSVDICGPHPLTPRKNRYLLIFICSFTKYAEAIPIPDMTAEFCARGREKEADRQRDWQTGRQAERHSHRESRWTGTHEARSP